MLTVETPVDPVQAVVEAFEAVPDEVETELRAVDGRVPPGIRGVLFRNGPGKLDVFGTPLMHPFDGDGMLARFEFADGQVRYRNRWVRTNEFLAEERAGRMLYRNFGTNLPGGIRNNALRMRFKNTANTSVVHHGQRLLALWEGGLPHALTADTLHTVGRFDYGGKLRDAIGLITRLLVGETPFSAHPKIDPESGTLYNFGLLVGPRPVLLFYEVDPDGTMKDVRRIGLRRACFMHDFVITERHAVFFATPIRFDVPRALSGLRSPVDAILRDENEATEVIVVPLDGGPIRRVVADSGFFIFHFFNAFEDGGRFVVDGCRMDHFAGGSVDLRDPEQIRNIPIDPAFATRWTIEPDAVHERRLSDLPMELPTIDPAQTGRPYGSGWATARTQTHEGLIYSGLARLHVDSTEVQSRDFSPDLPGEPIFVPDAAGFKPDPNAPRAGWLASVVYRARARLSELVILRPDTLDVVARLPLPHHLPPGFHGSFVPA